MVSMAVMTAARDKMPGRAMVLVGVSLLACCSLSLWTRAAPSPLILLNLSSATSGALAESKMMNQKRPGEAFAMRQSYSRSDYLHGDEAGRSLMAAALEQEEEAVAADEGNGENEDEGEEQEEEKKSVRRRELEYDDQGGQQATNREITGGALVEDGGEAVPPPVMVGTAADTTAVASVPAVPSDAAAAKRGRGANHKCWVFTHLQKSGGSTVKNVLVKVWQTRMSMFDTEPWKRGDDSGRTIGNKLVHGTAWSVMAGGYTAALKRVPDVADSCQFFIMFRHPIARIVSAYFFCTVNGHDKACASNVVRASHVGLLDFAKHWGNFAVRQIALSFVPSDDVQAYIRTPEARARYNNRDLVDTTGWYQLKTYLERPFEEGEMGAAALGKRATQEHMPGGRLQEYLQPAQDMITNGYTVGILEEWDTTLALFDKALAMPGMDWKKQFAKNGKQNMNPRSKSVRTKTLNTAWTDPELKKYIQLDLLLYEHAVDVFRAQARSHGLMH